MNNTTQHGELVHTVEENGITYSMFVDLDDSPVRGNALVSGNDAEDRAYEDEIIERLNRGDVWAWALVTVEASITIGDQRYAGTDNLGGCTYTDTADFMADGGYWQDMKSTAYDDLLRGLRHDVKQSSLIRKFLKGKK